jgi:hypothetical protein
MSGRFFSPYLDYDAPHHCLVQGEDHMNLVTPDLLYISAIANRAGMMAVIDGQGVAIFAPVRQVSADGAEHRSFRIIRVKTVNEAWQVVRSETVATVDGAAAIAA